MRDQKHHQVFLKNHQHVQQSMRIIQICYIYQLRSYCLCNSRCLRFHFFAEVSLNFKQNQHLNCLPCSRIHLKYHTLKFLTNLASLSSIIFYQNFNRSSQISTFFKINSSETIFLVEFALPSHLLSKMENKSFCLMY